MKTCPKCNQEKPLSSFGKDSRRKDKLRVYCRTCNSKVGNPTGDVLRDRNLKKRYGITLDDYTGMLEAQNGCCAICGIHEKHCDKNLAVDHDHETGEVRKLLCQHCNTGLGQFRDNPEFLANAIKYLEENQ